MATNAGITDDITKGVHSLSMQDTPEITLCSWNIFGSTKAGMAGARKKVVSATLGTQKVSGSKTTSLAQCDLICLQEFPSDLIKDHVPTYHENHYGLIQSNEPKPWNMILYSREKFTLLNSTCLDGAFDLMDIKKNIYDYIKIGGDDRIQKAIKGNLHYDPNPGLQSEVLEECKQAKDLVGFDALLRRYKGTQDIDTQSPKSLLERRMAIAVLRFRNEAPSEPLIVISFHSYGKSSGEDAPRRLTYLLLDFLEKVKMTGIYYPVIIAGDFNCNIKREPSLEKLLSNYDTPKYQLTSLRDKLIDFIIASKHDKPTQEITPVNPGHVQQVEPFTSGPMISFTCTMTYDARVCRPTGFTQSGRVCRPIGFTYRLPCITSADKPLASNPLEFKNLPIAHEMVLPPEVEAELLQNECRGSTIGPSAPETEQDRKKKLINIKRLITNHSPLSATLTI